MREWRKLHYSIITSDRLSKVSDSAKWLFALLVVAQDDEGKYPWTPPRINALTAGTDWDRLATESALTQLRVAGVSELRDGYVWLHNGVEYNGTPHNSKSRPKLYPPVSELTTESQPSRERVATESGATPRGEERRGDKSRVEREETPASEEAVSLSEPENQSTWPEWFSLGHGLKGWVISLDTADAWRITGGYSNEYCLDQVYKVRGWWTKKHEKDGRNPYSTFQQACRENWAKSPPEGGANNGIHPTSPGLAALAKYGSSNPVT